MEANDHIGEQIFEIIKNQIRDNTPPETKATFDRLRKQGFDDFQTRQMIGQCLAVELFDVMKFGKPYNTFLRVFTPKLHQNPDKAGDPTLWDVRQEISPFLMLCLQWELCLRKPKSWGHNLHWKKYMDGILSL